MKLIRHACFAASLAALASITSCAKDPSAEGTYVITKGTRGWPPIEATLANGKFVLSAGATGDYTVSDGKVLLTGITFNDVMVMRGDRLVGAKFEITRVQTSPATWATDCTGIAQANDKTVCLELRKNADAGDAQKRSFRNSGSGASHG